MSGGSGSCARGRGARGAGLESGSRAAHRITTRWEQALLPSFAIAHRATVRARSGSRLLPAPPPAVRGPALQGRPPARLDIPPRPAPPPPRRGRSAGAPGAAKRAGRSRGGADPERGPWRLLFFPLSPSLWPRPAEAGRLREPPSSPVLRSVKRASARAAELSPGRSFPTGAPHWPTPVSLSQGSGQRPTLWMGLPG